MENGKTVPSPLQRPVLPSRSTGLKFKRHIRPWRQRSTPGPSERSLRAAIAPLQCLQQHFSLQPPVKTHFDTRDKLAAFFEERIGWVTKAIALVIGGLTFFTTAKLLAVLKQAGMEFPSSVRGEFVFLSDQLVIGLYLGSWILGGPIDTRLQKAVYSRIVEVDRLRRIGNVAAAGLLILGASVPLLLFFASKTWFWLGMMALIGWDLFSWSKLMVQGFRATYRRTRHAMAADREPNHIRDLILLELVYSYVAGGWKWKRYVGMFLVAALGLLLSRFPDGYNRLSSWTGTPVYLLQAAELWLYLIVAEGWMWLYRLRCKLTKEQIEDMFEPGSVLEQLVLPDSAPVRAEPRDTHTDR